MHHVSDKGLKIVVGCSLWFASFQHVLICQCFLRRLAVQLLEIVNLEHSEHKNEIMRIRSIAGANSKTKG